MEQQPRWKQGWAITKIELRRAFFSRRNFVIYILALFPSLIFFFYGLNLRYDVRAFDAMGRITPAQMDAIQKGETIDAVLARLGKSPKYSQWNASPRRDDRSDGATAAPVKYQHLVYFDGKRQVSLRFQDDVLMAKSISLLVDFEETRQVFAGIFQFYYLRLAIFFGCLGIFMNLFRGEMLDKTLHFWFLAPARREVLLSGKYTAGLIVSTMIFVIGALLAFAVMMWTHSSPEVHAYWREAGVTHAFWYAAAAVLGCVSYGSIFLTAGLLLRNPIIPAAVLLAWEGISNFLPEILQKASILHYLQSLCPVTVPIDNDAAFLRMLLMPASPASHTGAIFGMLVITALMLWIACKAVRRMQISYGSEP